METERVDGGEDMVLRLRYSYTLLSFRAVRKPLGCEFCRQLRRPTAPEGDVPFPACALYVGFTLMNTRMPRCRAMIAPVKSQVRIGLRGEKSFGICLAYLRVC